MSDETPLRSLAGLRHIMDSPPHSAGRFYPSTVETAMWAYAEIVSLRQEREQLRVGHCDDCCCARAWAALGISDYTGRSIPEEISRLRAELVSQHESHAEYIVQLHADMRRLADVIERLRGEVQAWEDSAQKGHPSPCTLGPLCPYCEIERLRADCQRMWLFIAEQHCECFDEYNNKRPNECERCQILRAAQAAGGGE